MTKKKISWTFRTWDVGDAFPSRDGYSTGGKKASRWIWAKGRLLLPGGWKVLLTEATTTHLLPHNVCVAVRTRVMQGYVYSVCTGSFKKVSCLLKVFCTLRGFTCAWESIHIIDVSTLRRQWGSCIFSLQNFICTVWVQATTALQKKPNTCKLSCKKQDLRRLSWAYFSVASCCEMNKGLPPRLRGRVYSVGPPLPPPPPPPLQDKCYGTFGTYTIVPMRTANFIWILLHPPSSPRHREWGGNPQKWRKKAATPRKKVPNNVITNSSFPGDCNFVREMVVGLRGWIIAKGLFLLSLWPHN